MLTVLVPRSDCGCLVSDTCRIMRCTSRAVLWITICAAAAVLWAMGGCLRMCVIVTDGRVQA
jgi:hypothetical protein